MTNYDELLSCISPDCSYDEWLKIGMALKTEGAPFHVWDDWSSRGSKYHAGEMQSKWDGFRPAMHHPAMIRWPAGMTYTICFSTKSIWILFSEPFAPCRIDPSNTTAEAKCSST